MELLHLAVCAHGQASGVHDVEYRVPIGTPVAVFLLAEGRRVIFPIVHVGSQCPLPVCPGDPLRTVLALRRCSARAITHGGPCALPQYGVRGQTFV